MDPLRKEVRDGRTEIVLSGRIDSENADALSKELEKLTADLKGETVIIDASELTYISSAGLRVLLRLSKAGVKLRIIGVNHRVYEIFEMTGFTSLMKIERAVRSISVDGLEMIGRGANGTLYRIDRDNVVKVSRNQGDLDDILHEREMAKKALVYGIPTAISYEVVKVGDHYGAVFELLDCKAFAEILVEEPSKMDWLVEQYVSLLKKIHSTEVPKGELPDIREGILQWGDQLRPYVPDRLIDRLLQLVGEVPEDMHLIHGDYHLHNVQLVGDEVMIIDLDTLSVGYPIFELGFMYNSFVGYSEYDNTVVEEFQGFNLETSRTFWQKTLRAYLGTDDPARITEVENKARIIGYSRLLRRSIRLKRNETEDGAAEMALWLRSLTELLEKADTLLF